MNDDKHVVQVNALNLKSFDEKKFNPLAVYQSDQVKVILAYFKKGQFIPVHAPNIDVILCILEGEAEVVAGDERIRTNVHDLIIVPRGVKRGVKALTDLTVLHVVQPPPSEADHKEMFQKMSLGKFE